MEQPSLEFTWPEDEIVTPDSETASAVQLPAPSGTVRLQSVEMWNFKRAQHCKIDIPSMAVLTGVNNSGKTTVLNAICMAFEVLKLCVDEEKGTLRTTGRAFPEFESVPTNAARDLWHDRTWQMSQKNIPVRVRLSFSNGFWFEAGVRLLYGFLNAKVVQCSDYQDRDRIAEVLALDPVYVSGNVGIFPHEAYLTGALLSKQTAYGLVSQFMRNILNAICNEDPDRFARIAKILKRWLSIQLLPVRFDASRDVELRSEYQEQGISLDIVSAGSGTHQLLQIAAFLFYREGRLLLLDEPDSHLHYTLQGQLLSLLRELSSELGVQIVLATHSPALITAAELGQIVPVDFSLEQLVPVQAHEEVLTEIEKVAQTSNFSLAVLYQSRRCLFVEGISEENDIPVIAQQVGSTVFSGPRPVVPFRYDGTSNIGNVAQVVGLFQRVVGSTIDYWIVRDRDWLTDAAIGMIQEKARKAGIADRLFILPIYDVSNLALTPRVIQEAVETVAAQRGVEHPSVGDLMTICERACNAVLKDMQHMFVLQNQSFYRQYASEDARIGDVLNAATQDAQRLIDDLRESSIDTKLHRIDGKVVRGRIAQYLQSEYGINVRPADIQACLRGDDLPQEFARLLGVLAA